MAKTIKTTPNPVRIFIYAGIAIIIVVCLVLLNPGDDHNPPTEIPALTLEPSITPTPSEPLVSSGYTIYDDFNADNGLWKISGNEAKCPRQLENGTLKIECLGSDTEDTDLTFFPVNSNVLPARGLEMAFYTLPQPVGTNQWGKFHLQTRYGSGCDQGQFPRTYYTSTRPNELTFVETDGDFQSINPPSPKRPIGTNQIHVIKIELVNGKVTYYLDNEFIRDVSPLDNTSPVCWMFQSDDNDNRMADGYRGIVILWIATKP